MEVIQTGLVARSMQCSGTGVAPLLQKGCCRLVLPPAQGALLHPEEQGGGRAEGLRDTVAGWTLTSLYTSLANT